MKDTPNYKGSYFQAFNVGLFCPLRFFFLSNLHGTEKKKEKKKKKELAVTGSVNLNKNLHKNL